jgi:hypothetical protein
MGCIVLYWFGLLGRSGEEGRRCVGGEVVRMDLIGRLEKMWTGGMR